MKYYRGLYLIYFAGGNIPNTSLKQVLSFFSGSEYLPPLGFGREPVLMFTSCGPFPTASTCALQLCLPIQFHDKPDLFREKMLYALHNHGGFGLY